MKRRHSGRYIGMQVHVRRVRHPQGRVDCILHQCTLVDQLNPIRPVVQSDDVIKIEFANGGEGERG